MVKKKIWVMMECSRAVRWVTLVLLPLAVAGCTTQQPVLVPFPTPLPLSSTAPCDEQQQKIARLQQILADREQQISHLIADQNNKNQEIRKLKAHQQNQVKELEETTSQVSRAEVKLRRFATEADVASRLVEVEMALESRLNTAHELPLQVLAHGLLDKASTTFKRGKYSAAADQAAQAEQLVEMLTEPHSTTESAILFKVAIPLKTKVNSPLRRKPDSNAAVIDELQTATPIVAHSYQAQWLRVQTENGNSGWIFADFVEPR